MSVAINADILTFHEAVVASEGQLGLSSVAVGSSSGAVDIGQADDTLEICDQGRLATCAGKEKMND